jgi:hypothetical protein
VKNAHIVGWIIIVTVLAAVAFFGLRLMEQRGYCLFVCNEREEIEKARGEAVNATERAEDAEERANQAEKNLEGIPPWLGGLAFGLVILALLYNEVAGEGQGNLELEQAEMRCAEYVRKRHNLVPITENKHGYVRIWSMSGQIVPGSKDSVFYFISFVKNWPPGMSYPPNNACDTMWMLSTDPKRFMGFYPGINALEMHRVFANAKLQKTATPTDIAQALDNALAERQLADTVRNLKTEESE